MRAAVTALALVWTLLLALIFGELYQINRHLAWISAPARSLAAIGAAPARDETPEERRARIDRAVQERARLIEEMSEIWQRALTASAPSGAATARPSPESASGDSRRR